MFQTRLKTALKLLFLTLALLTSFLIGPTNSTAASSAPDFSLSASPTTRTIPRGGDALYTIHVTALNGFTGTVNLTVTGVPNHDVGSFTNASVTGTGDTQLDLHANRTESPLGTFTLTITGTSGSLKHTIQVTCQIVIAPDFSITLNASLQTIKPGGTAAYAIQVSAAGGFNEAVNWSVTSGLPANSTGSFTVGSVTPPGNTELDIHTNTQTPTGTFTVVFTGTSATITHSFSVTLEIIPLNSDFSLSATPTSQSIKRGDGAIYTINITAINGFNGTMNFTVTGLPALSDIAFGADGMVPGPTQQTIFIFTSTASPTGTFTLTVTATSGPLQHSVQMTLRLT